MEQQKELTILSELSLISVKNNSNQLEVSFLPQLKTMLNMASSHQHHTVISSETRSAATTIKERSSILSLSQPPSEKSVSGRTLVVKEQPYEIVIEEAIDENTLLSLSRLVGEHSPQSLNAEEAQSIVKLLEQDASFNILKYQRKGIRIVFRIPGNTLQPLHGLPPIFNQFTGREKELSQLKACQDHVKVISHAENIDLNTIYPESKKTQLAGTGGIGKSQLANYYARQQFREKKYQWVIWLSGGLKEKIAENALQSQFLTLGSKLGFDINQIKGKNLYQLVYRRLSQKGKGLIVFDDIPHYQTLADYLPDRFDQSNIDTLITTRNGRYFGPEIIKITLDVFSLNDAQQYIHRIIDHVLQEVTNEDVQLLAITLGRYPLALTQALAYIADKKCSIKSYCERYQQLSKARKAYLNEPVTGSDPYEQEKRDRDRQYKSTMAAVIQISLEQVEAICETPENYARALSILMAATYLASEVGIPKALLGHWIPEDEGEILIDQALTALRTLSLIEETTESDSYQMHQIVQDVLRLELTSQKVSITLLQWSAVIEKYLQCSESNESVRQKAYISLEVHCHTLALRMSQEAQNDQLLAAKSGFYQISGSACKYQGKDELAKIYYEKAMGCIRHETSRLNPREGRCLMDLGMSMHCCGDTIKAKAYLTKALPILKSTLGNEHIDVGRCWMNLGIVLLSTGDVVGAKAHLLKALSIFKTSLGNMHIDVGRCLSNLGLVTLKSGDALRGKELFESALPIFESNLGKLDAMTGACQMGLGSATLACGYPLQAKEHFENALRVLKAAYGDQNADVGRCSMSLGSALSQCGDPLGAIKHLEAALPILKSTLGTKHCDVGVCLLNLGGAFLGHADLLRAKEAIESALPILKATLGAQAADTARCWLCLGNISLLSSSPFLAKIYILKALDIFNKIFGHDHKISKFCQNQLNMINQTLQQASKTTPELAKWSFVNPTHALFFSILEGTSSDLCILLEEYLNFANEPDRTDNHGVTPLHFAVKERKIEHVRTLLNYVGFTMVKDARSLSASDYAIQENQPEVLILFRDALLKKYSAYQIDQTQLPKLVRICAQLGDEEGLKLLIHLKVPLDEPGPTTGQRALALATIKGHINCVRILQQNSFMTDEDAVDKMADEILDALSDEEGPKNSFMSDNDEMDRIADDILGILSDEERPQNSSLSDDDGIDRIADEILGTLSDGERERSTLSY